MLGAEMGVTNFPILRAAQLTQAVLELGLSHLLTHVGHVPGPDNLGVYVGFYLAWRPLLVDWPGDS